MKIKLLLLFLLCSTVSFAQDDSRAFVGVQYYQSVHKTLYSETSVLLGFKSESADEISIGPSFRYLPQNNIGHNKNYLGAVLNGQTGTFRPLLLNIQVEVLRGEWWLGDNLDPEYITVGKKTQFMTSVSVGYEVSEVFDVYLGLSPDIYNPRDYVLHGNKPFQQYSFNISLKYKIPFGELFSNDRIYSRR